MSEQATFEKVKGIVVEQLGVDEKEVKLEARRRGRAGEHFP